MMPWLCAGILSAGGTAIPTAVYSAVGLGSAGPVAGGWFAANMGVGLAAGGWMAALQTAAMTGPLLPVFGSAAAAGGVSCWAC